MSTGPSTGLQISHPSVVPAAALLAVATAAIAIGPAALAMCVLALVVRGLWRDLRGKV